MKKYLFLSMLFLSSTALMAQEEISFSADRPGATTSVSVMQKHQLQWETGFGYEHNRIGGADEKTWTINTSLFRLGITDNAEIRFQIDELLRKVPEEKNVLGIANLIAGTKVRIYDGQNAIPAISLLGNLLIPGGENSDFLPQYLGGQMHLLFQNDFGDKFGLGYELGADWNGGQPDIFAGLCLGYQATETFGLFVEEYNTFNCGTESWVECGASWMVLPRVQLDIATDISLNYPGKYSNISLGVSWLICK